MGFIHNWLRQDILNLSPYVVQSSENMLKLDAMESPFVIADNLKDQLQKKLKTVDINRYPSNHEQLKKVIFDMMDIPDNLDIMFGNGSDELIQILMMGLNKNDKVIGFNPSFVMYKIIATWLQLKYQNIDLDDNFDIPKVIPNAKIIFIAYPNNPTGNNFTRTKIEQIIAHNPQTLVVLDEAYYAYSNDSFIDDIDKFNNLVVLRTISKVGFAGLRLGIMIGKKATIFEFNKLKMPYNINSLTQVYAELLLTQKRIIKENAITIIKNRQIVFAELSKISKLKVYQSQANFILFIAKNSNDLFDHLLQNNILIKNLNSVIAGALRVTISKGNENQQFLNVVKRFYE